MLVRTLIVLTLAAITFAQPGSPPAAKAAKARVILVWTPRDHPWQTHMYRHECLLLAACLNQNPGVEAIVSPEPEWPSDPDVLKNAAAIVYYSRQAGDIVLGPAHRDEFRAMMRRGVGFVAIHWATKAQDPALLDEYIATLGGAFHEQPGWGLKTDKRPLIQIDAAHPTSRGWKPFDLHEEWYLGTRFHDKAQPLVKVDIDGKDQVLAWAFEREKGRSFGATLGHFHDNFANESFRRFIINGILWSAQVEVPAAGAAVAIDETLLKLPPEDDTRK